jgi:hypothetical protein
MWVKILILLLSLSQLGFTFELENFLITGNYESVVPQKVFRHDPCSRPDARQFEPNPRGCSWFWECKDNNSLPLAEPREGICPYNLHFRAEPFGCVYPENVNCAYDDINTPQDDCVAWQPMQLLPHEFECSKYRLCWENKTVSMDCPAGLQFSYFDNDCVIPFLADCHVVDNYCKSFEDEKLNKNSYSCTKYHVCNKCDGRFSLIELQCTEGTHYYNSVLNHCETGSCNVSFA